APFVLAVEAGEHVEERRLAGAVGADEAVDLAALDGEAHLRERDEPAEALGDTLDLEERRWRRRRGAHRVVSSRLRTAEGSSPAGRTSIITTIASPKISSSRIASQARPMRESCRRRLTTITSTRTARRK